MSTCKEREEVTAGNCSDHCFHSHEDGVDDVCCWCGDLFLAENCDEKEHGPYRPMPSEERQ